MRVVWRSNSMRTRRQRQSREGSTAGCARALAGTHAPEARRIVLGDMRVFVRERSTLEEGGW